MIQVLFTICNPAHKSYSRADWVAIVMFHYHKAENPGSDWTKHEVFWFRETRPTPKHDQWEPGRLGLSEHRGGLRKSEEVWEGLRSSEEVWEGLRMLDLPDLLGFLSIVGLVFVGQQVVERGKRGRVGLWVCLVLRMSTLWFHPWHSWTCRSRVERSLLGKQKNRVCPSRLHHSCFCLFLWEECFHCAFSPNIKYHGSRGVSVSQGDGAPGRELRLGGSWVKERKVLLWNWAQRSSREIPDYSGECRGAESLQQGLQNVW